MTDPRDHDTDRQLSALLSDAVSDVEPAPSLDIIRNRTKVTPMSIRRPWLFAVGGAVVATAAVITAIALAGGSLSGADVTGDDSVPPAGQTSTTTDPDTSPSPSEPEPSASETPAESHVVPIYFAGDTPDGTRLYREFQETLDSDLGTFAVNAAMTGTATDQDYRTLWPSGSGIASVTMDEGIVVEIVGAPHDLPADMTAEDARLAIQQVVYTAQAAFGQGRVPVQLLLDGGHSDQILGQPTSEPLANDSVLATLAHVSLTTPSEGQVVHGDTLHVSGLANSFEANVVVRLQRWEGTEVMFQEPLTALGYMEDKLFPFEGEFDISDVPPGDYVLMAMTDDPSGNGMSHTDTKRITVQ